MITQKEFNHLKISIEEETNLMKEYKNSKTPILKYSFGRKTLINIGTNHSRNIIDRQFKIIFKEINRENPDCVILEIEQKVIDIMEKESKEERKNYYGEVGIIYNFLNNEIKKLGADLSLLELADKLDKNEFSQDEIDAFKVYLIMIPEMINYDKNVEEAIKGACEYTKVLINKNIRKIMDSHALEYNKKKVDKLTKKDNLSICPLLDNNILSKIMRAIDNLRDYNMVKVTFEALNEYDKVMFFTGTNHLIRHKKIFEKFLGHSKSIII